MGPGVAESGSFTLEAEEERTRCLILKTTETLNRLSHPKNPKPQNPKTLNPKPSEASHPARGRLSGDRSLVPTPVQRRVSSLGLARDEV